MSGEDFVDVQLTETGKELCGAGELHVIKGQHHFTFRRDERQRVTRAFDWQRILATEFRDGKPLFEVIAEQHDDSPAASAQGERSE
jgi:hypothetical protein